MHMLCMYAFIYSCSEKIYARSVEVPSGNEDEGHSRTSSELLNYIQFISYVQRDNYDKLTELSGLDSSLFSVS